jgi:hypothetical protein
MQHSYAVLVTAFIVSAVNALTAESVPPAIVSFEAVASSSVAQILRDVGYNVKAEKTTPFMFGQTFDENKVGSDSRRLIEIRCAEMQVWNVYGRQRNDEAYLLTGICDRQSELTPDMLATLKENQSRTIQMLLRGATEKGVAMLTSLEPQRAALGRNLESEYLRIVLVDHGVWILPTLIVHTTTGRRSLVLQSFANNCHVRETSILCNGQKDWLQPMALKIAQELPLN